MGAEELDWNDLELLLPSSQSSDLLIPQSSVFIESLHLQRRLRGSGGKEGRGGGVGGRGGWRGSEDESRRHFVSLWSQSHDTGAHLWRISAFRSSEGRSSSSFINSQCGSTQMIIYDGLGKGPTGRGTCELNSVRNVHFHDVLASVQQPVPPQF